MKQRPLKLENALSFSDTHHLCFYHFFKPEVVEVPSMHTSRFLLGAQVYINMVANRAQLVITIYNGCKQHKALSALNIQYNY